MSRDSEDRVLTEHRIEVNLSELPQVKRLLAAADKLVNRVRLADEALLEDAVREAADDYRAIRQEWRP